MSLIAKGQLVTAARLNQIRTGLNNILGVGSGDSGYGQDVSLPNAINVGSSLTASLFDALRNDMTKCYVHQTNTNPTNVTASTAGGTLFPPNIQNVEPGDSITADLINQYNNFLNESGGVIPQKLTCHPNQRTPLASPINLFASNNTYTSAWNGIVVCDVTLTWNGYTTPGGTSISTTNHTRVFFNAGGIITIAASRSGGSSTNKNTSWTNLLSGAGTFQLSRSTWAGLTTSLSQIYSTTVGSGVYAENRYRIFAAVPTANSLRIRLVFNDLDSGDRPVPSPPPPYGPLVDENIDGTLTAIVGCLTANTSNVNVPMTRGTSFTGTLNSFGPSATET